IASAEDALEFILAGATAVAVGTANFYEPETTIKVIDGIEAYLEKYGFASVKDIIGAVD
ncbi:MAG: dihydroorotate dehydrogenase, partial [Lachnospiraceae bacterium]|nr:dihydroorotate dehydrogenase [Candidatus Equihabitans merdae]